MDRQVATDMLIDWDAIYALPTLLFTGCDEFEDINYCWTHALKHSFPVEWFRRDWGDNTFGRSFVLDGAVDRHKNNRPLYPFEQRVYRAMWIQMHEEVAVLPVTQ